MKLVRLSLAWLWVAIPLGWGVYQSVKKSLPLFTGLREVRVQDDQAVMESNAPLKK